MVDKHSPDLILFHFPAYSFYISFFMFSKGAAGRNTGDGSCHLYFPNWFLNNTDSGYLKKSLCLNQFGECYLASYSGSPRLSKQISLLKKPRRVGRKKVLTLLKQFLSKQC